jgi:hypothetical protein
MATLTVANAPSAGFPVGTLVKAYALKGANVITPPSGPPPGPVVEEPAVQASGQLTYTGLTEGTFYMLAAEVAGTWRYLHVYPDPAGAEAGFVTATGYRTKEGANAKMGTGTLVAGKVTVANTSVAANSRIFLTRTGAIAAAGALSVTAIVPGVSFTVESASGTDAGTFNYEIKEPA